VTSAGIAFDGERRPHLPSQDPDNEWRTTLREYPSLARQFARAERIRPWVHTGRMQRCSRRVAGDDWAMLPHAAYFFDPLFSAGNAHTLLGIQRLAHVFEQAKDGDSLGEQLAEYERQLFREITFLDWLVHGCYRTFGRFDLLSAYVMYYFAGAVQSETCFRNGAAQTGFLFSDFEPFRSAVKRSYNALMRGDAGACFPAELFARVASDIARFNPAGFCDAQKNNMYPFV